MLTSDQLRSHLYLGEDPDRPGEGRTVSYISVPAQHGEPEYYDQWDVPADLPVDELSGEYMQEAWDRIAEIDEQEWPEAVKRYRAAMLGSGIRYTVFEDSAGGLRLYVLERLESGEVALVYGHCGYEYAPGQLSYDLEALRRGEDPREWDNGLPEVSLEAYYDSDVAYSALIADEDGLYFDYMGVAGKEEFARELKAKEDKEDQEFARDIAAKEALEDQEDQEDQGRS